MRSSAYCTIIMIALISFVFSVCAEEDYEQTPEQSQVPVGMELKNVGKKSSYKVVLPKGSTMRYEGDLRIIEGTGEYASRKFVDYDARLAKMDADIAALRNDIEELKKTLSDMKKAPLTSK